MHVVHETRAVRYAPPGKHRNAGEPWSSTAVAAGLRARGEDAR